MPTIKTKKEMNLPELIEWGVKNGITSKEYTCDNKDGYKSVIFDIGGKVHLNRFQTYLADDKYEVEIEESITEDTVIPKMISIGRENQNETNIHYSRSIGHFLDNEDFNYYVLNDDDTLTLIWRDGKLVE